MYIKAANNRVSFVACSLGGQKRYELHHFLW